MRDAGRSASAWGLLESRLSSTTRDTSTVASTCGNGTYRAAATRAVVDEKPPGQPSHQTRSTSRASRALPTLPYRKRAARGRVRARWRRRRAVAVEFARGASAEAGTRSLRERRQRPSLAGEERERSCSRPKVHSPCDPCLSSCCQVPLLGEAPESRRTEVSLCSSDWWAARSVAVSCRLTGRVGRAWLAAGDADWGCTSPRMRACDRHRPGNGPARRAAGRR